VETETELLAERKEVRTGAGGEHPDQEGDPSALQAAAEGNQEWAMVLASRPSRSASGSVAKWVWPDPANRVRLGLSCAIIGRSSGIFSCGELAATESVLLEALNKSEPLGGPHPVNC
jgi:hypothetical protein